ncbi:MAG: FAD-binding oxidoreductase [Sphingobacteriaceae bacterium]|nr:FAD-binding oxidoreductase [Sphingobacteriaceae bacterium]
MKPYLIVGRGLSAFVLAHHLHQQKINFTIIGKKNLSRASLVAAGIWNPVVLHSLSKSWQVDLFLPYLINFYRTLEKLLGTALITNRTIIRPFSEKQEITLWEKKAQGEMREYLDPVIYQQEKNISGLYSFPLGTGKIKGAGNLDIPFFIQQSETFFQNKMLDETFNHNSIKIINEGLEYNKQFYRGIIFCEGHLMKNNPFFNYLPLKPVKGELINFVAKNLTMGDSILSKGKFILKMGSEYKAGSTFNWNTINEEPETDSKIEIEKKISELIVGPFKTTAHRAGIRASVKDRRPLIGVHPKWPNLFLFNGFGSKGVLLTPYLANNLVNFIAGKESIMQEADIARFNSYYLTNKKP